MKNNFSILTGDRAFPVTSARAEPPKYYVGIAVFMSAIVLAGFWAPYFAPLLPSSVAAAFSGNLVFSSADHRVARCHCRAQGPSCVYYRTCRTADRTHSRSNQGI